ncbi:MAG TPA: vitamin K epoxide reductase family protein [Candidatus Saccharimonadales bacterium]|nr:vitamin K epoxide reductase family protein [Candidatus Saccharimonadales bacterium]
MSKSVDKKPLPNFVKILPVLLIICGVIGMIMAFALTYDELKLAANPNYIPSCNLNPIISCGSVMKSSQAHIFGFPNPIIGLAAFPVLLTSGVVMLSGAKLKRWYYVGLEIGAIGGIAMVTWLFFETVYHIHALCPYCMGTWIVTITSFIYITMYNLQTGNIKLGKSKRLSNFLMRHHLDILVLWFVIIAGLILKHFWYYYGHYF